MIKAFQTRRLRARGDIGEKALTEKDMEILKNIGLYFNVPAQDDNDTEEGAADLDGNIMRQMRIHVEGDKATFVKEVDESIDNDQDIYQHDGYDIYQYFDEEPGGCYNAIRSDKSDDHSSSSSSRLVNDNGTAEGVAAELDGNIMRQMRIHVEGDKSTFVEEVAESLDNDPDIYQHDGQDVYQYFDEEPGGRYNIISIGKSDDHSSSSSSRLVNENKNLIEKVHRLEEELRECIEEREIWKLKATKLQEDLIGKLMSYEYE